MAEDLPKKRVKSPGELLEYFELTQFGGMESVLRVPTESFPGSHFATYPRKLVRACVKAGSRNRRHCTRSILRLRNDRRCRERPGTKLCWLGPRTRNTSSWPPGASRDRARKCRVPVNPSIIPSLEIPRE